MGKHSMPSHRRLCLTAGQRFGRLTVLESAGNDKHQHGVWRCLCECGSVVVVAASSLTKGNKRSCGCLKLEVNRAAGKALAAARALRTPPRIKPARKPRRQPIRKTPTYGSWRAMRARCHNPNNIGYKYYGALGISVTKPWRDSFESFLNDMGERPVGMTIDRIDRRFGYFAANCRWATPKQQAANRGVAG